MSSAQRFNKPAPAASGDDVTAFVAAAPRKSLLPWQMPSARDDLRVEMNTRISERLMLKVKWLAVQQNRPLREVVTDALEEYFKREAKVFGVTP